MKNSTSFLLFLLVPLTAFLQSLPQPNTIPSNYTALSGWHGGIGANTDHMLIAPGIANTYISQNSGADGYLHKARTAISVSHSFTSYDILEENAFNFSISPKLLVGKNTTVAPSLSFNYSHLNVDFTKKHSGFDITGHPYVGETELNYTYLGIGAGGAVFHKNFVAAAQANFINRPRPSIDKNIPNYEPGKLPAQVSFYAAQRIQISEKYSISPSASYTRVGDFRFSTASLNFQRDWLYLSAGYELNNSLLFGTGVEIKNAVRLAYIYEFTVSQLSTTNVGGHQLSVRTLLFRNKAKRSFMEEMPLL